MKKLLLVTAIALALSACGGGGSGSSDSEPNKPEQPPVIEQPGFENPKIKGYFERQVGYEDKTESYRFSGNEYDYRKWCWEPTPCKEYTEYGTVEYREELMSSSGTTVRKIIFFTELVNGKDKGNVTRNTYNYQNSQVVFGNNFGSNMEWDHPYWKQ